MVGWHHQFNGHEFEQAPGDSEGQGSLMCCSPWGRGVRRDLVSEQPQPSRYLLNEQPVKTQYKIFPSDSGWQ